MEAFESLPPAGAVSSGGQMLHVGRLGRGPRLVLLHGGPGLDHRMLYPLAFPLARRFEVWLPDLPGHGRSHTGDSGLPDLDDVLERTARWLAALDPPAEAIAGHSLGAWLVRELLRDSRVRPRAAVLISPPVGPASGASAAQASRKPRPARRSAGRSQATLRDELIEFCAQDAPAPPSTALVRAVADARLRPPEGYVALQRQLEQALSGPIPACRPGCPVLLLCGAADRRGPIARIERLVDATAGSRLRLLEGEGHVPFACSAEGTAGAMHEFFSECGLPGPGRARR